MAVLCGAIIFASALLAMASSLTITNEDPVLPTQQLLDDNSFLRISPNNEEEVVRCPKGTYLDKSTLICQFTGSSTGKPAIPFAVCASQGIGDFINPENCRTFVSCGSSSAFTVTCAANLLYNGATMRCDDPRRAGCCEYVENNSSRLIQNAA